MTGKLAHSVVCVQENFFFFSSRRRHTRCSRDWSSDVCSSDLVDWSAGKCRATSSVPGVPDGADVVMSRTSDSPLTGVEDRKSTRLNSSHGYISYAGFCLQKKNKLHASQSSLSMTTSVSRATVP